MLQGNQNPISEVGIIPGKGFLDMDLIDTWQENARNPMRALGCYPNGKDDGNFDAMPGDSVFGLKGVRSLAGEDGEASELGVVAVCGLPWDDYCSQEHMEQDFYWQGVIATESRLTAPLDSTTNDPPHGYATVKAGTKSIINNGHKTIYAGDRVCWQFPRAPFHPKSDGEIPDINRLARQGTPPGQIRPQIVPFDPLDFDCQTSGAFAAITHTKAVGGVSNMGFINALPSINIHGIPNERPWTNVQDTANGFKFPFWSIALTLLQTLLRNGLVQAVPENLPGLGADANTFDVVAEIANEIGLFDTDAAKQSIMIDGLAAVFLRGINANDVHRERAERTFLEEHRAADFRSIAFAEPDANDHRAMLTKLQLHQVDILLQGITRAWWSKTSKIFATSLNTAAPQDTTHCLLGHHVL